MTRRERVLAAIGHQEADRVPVDLGGMRSTGITAIAYNHLKAHLGLRSGRTLVYDVVQQLAQPEPEILELAGADVVDLGRVFLTAEKDWKEFVLADGTPARIPGYVNLVSDDRGGWQARSEDNTLLGAMPRGAPYLHQEHFPLQDWDGRDPAPLNDLPRLMAKVTWAAFPTAPFHRPLTPEHLAEIRRQARHLYETSDYAIMAGFGGNLLEWGQFLCRFDQFLLDILADRPKVERLLDRLVEVHLENLEKFLDAVEGYVQIIQMGDDLGTQLAPQISPQTYRELFKPRHRLLYERVRRRRGMHLFLHSCGSIADLLPDLIDSGVEIINPVQTSARGMDPQKLKREYGNHLTFWGGGCDTQTVLPQASPTRVAAHVRERLKILAPGGGFVFAQVHNIMPTVPPENILAMWQAVRDFQL